MTADRSRSGGRTRLERQADEILDDTEDVARLVARLELGHVKRDDRYADWHASTPLVPMVRTLLLKELEDHSYSELHRRLSDNPDEADLLGLEDVPARTTFGRAWRDRIDDNLRQMIEFNARRIRELAHERGCAIGLDAIEPEDKSDTSQHTEDRFINEKAREVTEEMQRLVFPVFDFDRAENAKYNTDAFCEVQSHLGLSASAAESGTDLFVDDTQREDSRTEIPTSGISSSSSGLASAQPSTGQSRRGRHHNRAD